MLADSLQQFARLVVVVVVVVVVVIVAADADLLWCCAKLGQKFNLCVTSSRAYKTCGTYSHNAQRGNTTNSVHCVHSKSSQAIRFYPVVLSVHMNRTRRTHKAHWTRNCFFSIFEEPRTTATATATSNGNSDSGNSTAATLPATCLFQHVASSISCW